MIAFQAFVCFMIPQGNMFRLDVYKQDVKKQLQRYILNDTIHKIYLNKYITNNNNNHPNKIYLLRNLRKLKVQSSCA